MNINFAEIEDIKARRKAFIEDEASFYHSGNRAVMPYGDGKYRCVYTPTETSPGCAIGRHLDRDCVIIRENLIGSIGTFLQSYNAYLVNSTPLWMREMGSEFLQSCQTLHDEESFWDENGLSEAGKVRFNQILEEFC